MLNYSLSAHSSVYWLTKVSADLEKAIVSVERVKEYSEVPGETDTLQQAAPRPATWPHSGEIVFSGYSTRYALELSTNLREVSQWPEKAERPSPYVESPF